MRTGQEIRTDSGAQWFFDAGRVSLDFAHTGGFEDDPEGVRPRARLGELLASPADLDEWLGDHTAPIDIGATPRELVDARALRSAIARLASAAGPPPQLPPDARRPPVTPDDIDTVNLFAALPDVPPALAGGRRRAGANRVRAAQALSSIARDAVALFAEVGFDGAPDVPTGVAPAGPAPAGLAPAGLAPTGRGRTLPAPTRLGRCSAPDCGLLFYDASRGGTRRWCSMQRCGNRAKVRAHRERAR